MANSLSSAITWSMTISPGPGISVPSLVSGGKNSGKLSPTPLTNVSLSPRKTSPTERRVTSFTCGSSLIEAATSGVNVAVGSNWFSGSTITSAFTSLDRMSSMAPRKEATMVEASATRVMLIITATAVAAVRRGVRMAFSRASLPVTP